MTVYVASDEVKLTSLGGAILLKAKSKYNQNSVQSIYEYSLQLENKSLSCFVSLSSEQLNSRNKGNLGVLLEKYFYEFSPPNNHDPDFSDANLELKVTGVVRKKNKVIAKERLVLGLINYESLVNETWEDSTLLYKCNSILLIFYEYLDGAKLLDRKFIFKPFLHILPSKYFNERIKDEQDYLRKIAFFVNETDLEIIKNDWNVIRDKVLAGKAHELSEGDTYYLGACRKGTGGKDEILKVQPCSKVLAKSRAFAFKPSYISRLLSSQEDFANLMGNNMSLSFEEAIQKRFEPFLNRTPREIASILNIDLNKLKQKALIRTLVDKMLEIENRKISEISKAGIEIKTVRMKINGNPRESMSFPGFNYFELINQSWEDSKFFEKIEKKFLLVVFQEQSDGREIFSKAVFWNMPYEDRELAKAVFEETKKRILINCEDLPSKGESTVAHVRPKARNGNDKLPTPQGTMVIRKCFWLNDTYIRNVISNL